MLKKKKVVLFVLLLIFLQGCTEKTQLEDMAVEISSEEKKVENVTEDSKATNLTIVNHVPENPINLMTELLNEAYGIDTKNPSFSWTMVDEDENEVQTAYRIIVSKTCELLGDVFDTGWRESSENTYVHIPDLEDILDDNQLYYWQVQIKDGSGAQSELSEAAPFMTDISSEWKSTNGIWAKAEENELANFSFFRSPSLEIQDISLVDKAIISASCRGTELDKAVIFDLYFNGTCIGAGSARELANVGTASGENGYTRVYYNSYDVTSLLQQGNKNVISAVGNCRSEDRGILIQMTVFYKDGSKEIITNSGINFDWKVLNGTDAFGDDGNNIWAGYMCILHENINAEHYPSGWKNVEYDDSLWEIAQITCEIADGMEGTERRVLYPYPSENIIRVITDEPSKLIYENAFGNIVIDLGKELIGGMKVNISSAQNQNIVVRMGEELNEDGTVKYQLAANPMYEDTWSLIQGENIFDTVTMRNFRYVEFIGLDEETKKWMLKEPDCVLGWAIRQEFDENMSEFQAAGSEEAELLNRLYELCKYTIEATNQDVYVDSQARERAPYEGDLLVNSNMSYVVSNQYSLARHSNEWLIDNPTWPNDYFLFSVEMAYWDYMYTGNVDSIREYYDALKMKLTTRVVYEDETTGLISGIETHVGNGALIDWPVTERDGYEGAFYDVIFNAEYVGMYNYMSAISKALGMTEDSIFYRKKAECLKESLIRYAYDEVNSCFYDSLDENYMPTLHSSTHASAYALTYSVFDSQEMADGLCKFVYNKCKEEFKGSVYASYFILKGLYVGNHGELAQRLITNPLVGKNVKTFASLLDNLNCTITPEAWGHAWKDNMTFSHPWGASPGCSIVQGMFGVLPLEAGFELFSIKLQPGDILEARMSTPTMKGDILVSYSYAGMDTKKDKLVVEVTIPVNTKAVVSLPAFDTGACTINVNGEKMIAENDGIYLSTMLGSGHYTLYVENEISE